VNQRLTEMDGLESRRSVFVIAATNRPELIDPAMMRPGLLDKLLYVPLPTSEERVSIPRALAAKVTLGCDVDLEMVRIGGVGLGAARARAICFVGVGSVGVGAVGVRAIGSVGVGRVGVGLIAVGAGVGVGAVGVR
jgi:ATP-dependent 26S proteasome regulatory subunit